MNDAQRAAANVERAGEPHLHRFIGPRDFPRIGPRQPMVRLLALPAVAHCLLEDAVFVAQPAAHARNAERGHRIEKTRRQPAQSSIAQAGIRLLFDNIERVNSVELAQPAHDRVEPQVDDIVGQRATHEKFEREIINALGVALLVGLLRLEPPLRKHVANRARNGFEFVPRRGGGDGDDLIEREVALVKGIIAAGQFHGTAVVTLEEMFSCHKYVVGCRQFIRERTRRPNPPCRSQRCRFSCVDIQVRRALTRQNPGANCFSEVRAPTLSSRPRRRGWS